MEKSRDYTINAVKKAINLLKLFDDENRELTLSELSSMSGIGKSTMLRMLYTLNVEEFIDYDEETKKYSLGIELYRLGELKFNSLDVRKISKRYLQKLCDANNLICYLGVRHGDQLVMLDRYFPYNAPAWTQFLVPDNNRELYSTGIGRLFLAAESDEEVSKYLDRVEIRNFTDSTVTDKLTLLELVRQARTDGYSGNMGENESLICSLCAPVYNLEKEMVAGISICGPKDMIWGENFDSYLKKIQATAAAISRELGYRG